MRFKLLYFSKMRNFPATFRLLSQSSRLFISLLSLQATVKLWNIRTSHDKGMDDDEECLDAIAQQ